MEKSYVIQDIETGNILSKINLFTNDEKMYLVTTKEHAEWLVDQFEKEKTYKVAVKHLAEVKKSAEGRDLEWII